LLRGLVGGLGAGDRHGDASRAPRALYGPYHLKRFRLADAAYVAFVVGGSVFVERSQGAESRIRWAIAVVVALWGWFGKPGLRRTVLRRFGGADRS
jgi:hypothetical protein